jgi:hypothetical protein
MSAEVDIELRERQRARAEEEGRLEHPREYISKHPRRAPEVQHVPSKWWPNAPIYMTATLQGKSGTTIFDETQHEAIADNMAVVIQGWYPDKNRNLDRIDALGDIREINPDIVFVPHCMAQETWKVPYDPPGNSELEVCGSLIRDPIEGNPNWFVHRVGKPGNDGLVEPVFDQTNLYQCNMACLVSGLNKLGETYGQAFYRRYQALIENPAANMRTVINGYFQDVFNQRPGKMTQGNGSTTITDHDFDADGVIDAAGDYSAKHTAGGREWAEGHLHFIAAMELHCPPEYMLFPNTGNCASDYTDSGGSPPRPLNKAPFYQKLWMPMLEHMNLKLGISRNSSVGTGYKFEGWGSINNYFRSYEIAKSWLKPDDRCPGTNVVMLHATCFDRATTPADLVYMRFTGLLPLLVERGAPSIQQYGNRPYSLDELLLDLGEPLASRSMGTLNEETMNFSQRAPDVVVGKAQFYIVKCERGIIVIRCDPPTIGTYPSSDAAVACPLTPPSGKKHQRFNAATYENPKTHRRTRGQDTTLNNGQDCTSTPPMLPFTAFAALTVNDDGTPPDPPDPPDPCDVRLSVERDGQRIRRVVIDVGRHCD